MQFCDSHWLGLRSAIEARGLGELIAGSSRRAFDNTVRDLGRGAGEGPSIATFDPLMAAHWAIVNRVMDVLGLAVMMHNEDGSDRCPICFAKEQHAQAPCPGPPACIVDDEWFEAWIPSVADAMASEWERLKREEAAA